MNAFLVARPTATAASLFAKVLSEGGNEKALVTILKKIEMTARSAWQKCGMAVLRFFAGRVDAGICFDYHRMDPAAINFPWSIQRVP